MQMRPIVDGIQEDYGDQIEVLYLNAGTDAAGLFTDLSLPGHPSVVIVTPDGTEHYRGFGILADADLRARLDEILGQM